MSIPPSRDCLRGSLAAVAVWMASAATLPAASFYVSPSGSNTNPGTLSQPFLTIDHAIEQCSPGDEVVVRGGVYRDPVIPNRSGTQQAPVVIRPFHNGVAYEKAEVRGLVPIVENTGGAGAWQVHDAGRNIYKIQLTADWDLTVGADGAHSNQLFCDDELLVEARWPNIASYANMRESSLALGSGSYTGSANPYTGTYTSAGLQAFGSNALAGARIVFNPGQRWFVLTGNVTANNPAAGSVTFTFNKATFNFGGHFPDSGDRFYLAKHLELLDAPGEWFFDHAGAHGPAFTLYVRMPDDAPPSGRALEMRRHDRFVDLSASGWLRFEKMHFTAAYIFGPSTQHGFAFDACTFREGVNGLGRSGIFLNGNNNTFANNSVSGSAGYALYFRDSASGNIVENNVFSDSHYLGGEGPAVSVAGAVRVARNTVFNAGGHGIHVLGQGALVQRNHVYNFGALVQDVAGINAFGGGDQGGAEWSYNIVHDGLAGYGDYPGNNGSLGIRIDNGESATACYNLVLHHNLVYAVSNSGLNVWGVKDSQLAAGDTQADVNIRVFNNTCVAPAKMVGVSTGTDYKFTGIAWRNNIVAGPLTSNRPEALADATIADNLLAYNTLAGNTRASASFVDPVNADFQLAAGSPGINAGAPLLPFTDDVVDGLPDMGALERGLYPWRVGAVMTADQLAGLTLAYEGGQIFTLGGIPAGRTLPDEFAVRIGGSRLSGPDIEIQGNAAAGAGHATVTVNVDGLEGSPGVEYSLDGVNFIDTGKSVNLTGMSGVVPTEPSNIAFYHASDDRVTLWWRDTADNETGFLVQAATDPAFSTGLLTATKPANDTAHTFTGLVPDTTYFFRVKATGAGGDSPFSEARFITVGALHWTIQHPDDDGYALSSETVLNSPSAALNAPYGCGFRFDRLPVPSGATIVSASLQFSSALTETRNTAKARIWAEDADHSAAFTTAAGSISGRAKTAGYVDWNTIPAWNEGEVSAKQTTPDLAALVQAVVNRTGWREGNALTFLTKDNGSTSFIYRAAYHADDSLSRITLKIRFTTGAAPAAAPGTVAAVAGGTTAATVSWAHGGAGHHGFYLERSTNPDRGFSIIATVPSSQLGYEDAGLIPGTTYYYRLRAYNGGGMGPVSATAAATTEAATPVAAPAGFSATGTAHDRIALAWTNQSTDETGFEIQRSVSGAEGTFSTVGLPAGSAVAMTDQSGLSPQTSYFYRIRALGALNNPSAWVTAGGATLPLPAAPAAPTGLSASALGTGSVQLEWADESGDETGFLIERSGTGLLGSFTALATVGANATGYTDTRLALGARYYYRIRSTNGVTHSAYTPVATVATAALQTIASDPTTGWYWGRTGSTPPATLTVQNASELAHFTGGAAGSSTQYASFWRYFPSVTLADGDSLRLAVTFACQGTPANIERALRFGFFNANGTQLTTNIGGDNNTAQLDDYGYGIALGSGTSATSRYVEDRASETSFAPLRNGFVNLGADTGSLAINDTADHTLVFELSRVGADLHVRATVDGALFDGGRVVAGAANFTFDMLLLDNRSSGLTWTMRSLAVSRSVPSPVLGALQAWRLAHFDTVGSESRAADDADPDGDALANLLEFALGGDPLAPGDAVLPVPDAGGPRLTLSFTPQTIAGLAYFVESSSDLVIWTPTDVTSLLTPGAPFTFTDAADLAATPRRFLRLRVTAP